MGVWHLYFAFFLYLSLFGSKGSGIRGRQIELNTHYLVCYFRFKYSKLTRGETLESYFNITLNFLWTELVTTFSVIYILVLEHTLFSHKANSIVCIFNEMLYPEL